MFSKFDKAAAAAVGAAAATALTAFFPMAIEMQGALTIVLSGVLTWLVPNKEA